MIDTQGNYIQNYKYRTSLSVRLGQDRPFRLACGNSFRAPAITAAAERLGPVLGPKGPLA